MHRDILAIYPLKNPSSSRHLQSINYDHHRVNLGKEKCGDSSPTPFSTRPGGISPSTSSSRCQIHLIKLSLFNPHFPCRQTVSFSLSMNSHSTWSTIKISLFNPHFPCRQTVSFSLSNSHIQPGQIHLIKLSLFNPQLCHDRPGDSPIKLSMSSNCLIFTFQSNFNCFDLFVLNVF